MCLFIPFFYGVIYSFFFIVYDKTSLYVFGRMLAQNHFTVTRAYKGTTTRYTLKFELVDRLTKDSEKFPEQAVNVLIRKLLIQMGYVKVRRNLLRPEEKEVIPGIGVEVWKGLRLYIYRTLSGFVALVDKCAGVVQTRTLLEEWNQTSPDGQTLLAEDLKGESIVTKFALYFL